MRTARATLLLALAFWLPASTLAAQATAPLRVGTKVAEPFVIRQGDKWSGIAIELWEKVAAQLGRKSAAYAEDKVSGLLDGVAKGERYDIAVAALTVTSQRERKVDFTHPILTSGLGVAVSAAKPGGIWSHVQRFFSRAFFQVVAALSLVLLVCGTIVWFFERRGNPEQFGGKGLRGIGEGFWFAAVTMTTVGYGDRSPKTLGGRVVTLVWMFASLLLIANYTAGIASALTVERLSGSISTKDLPRIVVGTARDSSAAEWLTAQGYRQRGFETVRDALRALESREIKAVVYDKPILQYLTQEEFVGKVDVLPDILRRESYAFALPNASPLREEINHLILEVTDSPAWVETQHRYLGN